MFTQNSILLLMSEARNSVVGMNYISQTLLQITFDKPVSPLLYSNYKRSPARRRIILQNSLNLLLAQIVSQLLQFAITRSKVTASVVPKTACTSNGGRLAEF